MATDAIVESSPTEQILSSMTSEQNAEWRKTGVIDTPPEPPPEAAPVTADTRKDEAVSEAQAETAPASEPEIGAKPEKSSRQAKRISELVDQRNAAREKAEALQARLDAIEAAKHAAPVIEAKGKPKPEDFTGPNAWEQYNEALTDWKVDRKLAETKEREAADAANARSRTVLENYNEQVSQARATYDDFDEVLSKPSTMIPQVAQVVIMNLDNGAEVAYFLAKNPGVRDELLKSAQENEVKAILELGRISDRLAGKSSSIAPPKKVTSAPPPVTEVGNKGTTPRDPIRIAIENGDFERYRALMNAKERKL